VADPAVVIPAPDPEPARDAAIDVRQVAAQQAYGGLGQSAPADAPDDQ
jgi:hypothetical protein